MTLDEILLEKKPSVLISSLHEFVTDPNIGGVAPEDLQKAPPLVRSTIYLDAFDLAIANSGIWKWFEELRGDYPDFTDFLRVIKADRAADYLKAAEALFPNGIVPEDEDERFDFCDEHGREFRQVDHQFEGASGEAILKFRDYVVANKESFQQEAEAYWNIRKENRRLRHKK